MIYYKQDNEEMKSVPQMNDRKVLSRCLFGLYALNYKYWRKIILNTVLSKEGGEFYSGTARRIYGHYHNIEIGMYSYGGCFSLENVAPGTTFGRYCSVAASIKVLNGNHPLKFKSLHPFFYNPSLGYVDELLITRSRLVVENDVWIGYGTIILPSVTRIANGAVIGAGSVITKNVPPFAVVVGNPARIIKYRFSQEIMTQLLKKEWWKKDIAELKQNETEFNIFLKPYVNPGS